jgi:hypothetical protein
MPVNIENTSNRNICLCYKSGQVRYLAPGEKAMKVLDSEVSEKIERLHARNLVKLRKVRARRSKKSQTAKVSKSKVSSSKGKKK